MQVNTIIHGDCLEVMPQLPNGSVDMILCDLPYGTTACKWDTIIPFEPLWEQYKRIIKSNGAIVLTASQPFTSALVMSNPKWFRYEWVWAKNKPTGYPNANYMPLKDVENICVFSNGKPNPMASIKIKYFPQGIIFKQTNKTRTAKIGSVNNGENDGSLNGNYISNYTNYPRQLLEFKSETKTVHPTQKPVALFEYLIKTYTNENDLVLDNCAGSGTTGVACKNLNRNFILIEKDLGYFNIAQTRIAAIQKQNVLFGTGNLHKHNERLIA